jgi:hypothetical protein
MSDAETVAYIRDQIESWINKPRSARHYIGRIVIDDLKYDVAFQAIKAAIGTRNLVADECLQRLPPCTNLKPLFHADSGDVAVVLRYASPSEATKARDIGCVAIIEVSSNTEAYSGHSFDALFEFVVPEKIDAPLRVEVVPEKRAAPAPELAYLTCPVCQETAEPPWQACCVNGHLLCVPCHAQLTVPKKCPTCRESAEKLIPQRLFEEALRHHKWTFEIACRNTGCETKVPWDMLQAHKEACAHRPYYCPIDMVVTTHCNWQGPAARVLEHIQSEHDVIMVEGDEMYMHRSIMDTGACWLFPKHNMLVVAVGSSAQADIDRRQLGFFSLLAESQAIRLTATSEQLGFDLAVTLEAPSYLVGVQIKKPGRVEIARKVHAAVMVPAPEGHEMMLRMARATRERKRKEPPAEKEPAAKVRKTDEAAAPLFVVEDE